MPSIVNANNSPNFRIEQGDVFKDIQLIENFDINRSDIQIRLIKFPYIIVLSQDCDIREDYCNRKKDNDCDKKLFSLLVAPLYNSKHFFEGNHLDKLKITAPKFNVQKTDGKSIINNNNPRYHYLEFPEGIDITPVVIDFKHYFTINPDYLISNYNEGFVCKVKPIFRESILQRFAFYLSRIGLPIISEKGTKIPEDKDCKPSNICDKTSVTND